MNDIKIITEKLHSNDFNKLNSKGSIKYNDMQNKSYQNEANNWSLQNRNPVVGTWDKQNSHKNYERFLFLENKNINIQDLKDRKLAALDFGCGPGRNIIKFNNYFKKFDGVDISLNNLKNAQICIQNDLNKIRCNTTLYHCNGRDLRNIPSNNYDLIMSVISIQHICVHEIRNNYYKEFYRLLNSKGVLTFQVPFLDKKESHRKKPGTVGYYDNFYDAKSTNGNYDFEVSDPKQIIDELKTIGFKNINYTITSETVRHSGDWMYINCIKL